MKLNLKILKAINEGIRKSLLSFDDIEFDKTISTNTNQKVAKSIKDWKWIQDNFVDLGLPSGTLWMKYNLGATCGDARTSWYGHYYMWGSTNSNGDSLCEWKTAPFNNGQNDEYNSDYFEVHMHEFVDQDGQLLFKYDTAYLIDTRIHMPTHEQFEELCSLPNEWVYDYNGIKLLGGRIFTGLNGNTLFIPDTGELWGTHFYNIGSLCNLWSKTLDTKYQHLAFHLYFDRFKVKAADREQRFKGFPIRAVCEKF